MGRTQVGVSLPTSPHGSAQPNRMFFMREPPGSGFGLAAARLATAASRPAVLRLVGAGEMATCATVETGQNNQNQGAQSVDQQTGLSVTEAKQVQRAKWVNRLTTCGRSGRGVDI